MKRVHEMEIPTEGTFSLGWPIGALFMGIVISDKDNSPAAIAIGDVSPSYGQLDAICVRSGEEVDETLYPNYLGMFAIEKDSDHEGRSLGYNNVFVFCGNFPV